MLFQIVQTRFLHGWHFSIRDSIFNSFSAWMHFRFQNLTSTDVRFLRLRTVPTLKKLKRYLNLLRVWTKLFHSFGYPYQTDFTFKLSFFVLAMHVRVCRLTVDDIYSRGSFYPFSKQKLAYVLHVELQLGQSCRRWNNGNLTFFNASCLLQYIPEYIYFVFSIKKRFVPSMWKYWT